MDSAAPSEQSPLVQPKKSRRFVAGAAIAASAVLGLLAVTSARLGGLRAADRAAFLENPCWDNCKDVCGAKGVAKDEDDTYVAICAYRTRLCGHDESTGTYCDCVLPWHPPAKMACCSLDGRLDGKVTKECKKPVDCGDPQYDHDVCACACNQ